MFDESKPLLWYVIMSKREQRQGGKKYEKISLLKLRRKRKREARTELYLGKVRLSQEGLEILPRTVEALCRVDSIEPATSRSGL